jgi:SEC-C motif-containing protein
MSLCPCGSGESLELCCGRYLDGEAAPTAEALMRSRYSAYVLDKHNYLMNTWHSDSRPDEIGGTALQWIGLEIVQTEQGEVTDSEGVVEFIASYVTASKGKRLHETSRFVRENGLWFYVDGQCCLTDIGRNDQCPCRSGKKFKRCCGASN